MAITPRTILTHPASAAMAAASVLAVTLGFIYISAPTCRGSASVEPATEIHDACQYVGDEMGHQSSWTEFNWYQVANCYESQGDSHAVIDTATTGLQFYPRSETLYNLKGYHEIETQQYTQAVNTLELGLKMVDRQSTGTMANNLAWAGLWTPRDLDLDRSRALYQSSLRTEPNMCEALHTGLWVEYAIARESHGLERAHALRTFNHLRDRYEGCESRYDDGDRRKLMEVMGAGVLYTLVDKELGLANHTRSGLMVNVARELRTDYMGASIDELCRDASPMASVHHACAEVVDQHIQALKRAERAHTRGRKNCRLRK